MEVTNLKIPCYHPLDPDKAAAVMREAYSRIKAVKWISAGTALGLYRDGDFIKDDSDIDIAMVGYKHIAQQIINDFSDCELIRFVYHGGNIQQMAFYMDDIIVDLFFHWKDGEYYYNHSEFGITRTPIGMYDNVVEVDTKYGKYNFPNTPEDYFELRYGPDWRTPKDEKPRFL